MLPQGARSSLACRARPDRHRTADTRGVHSCRHRPPPFRTAPRHSRSLPDRRTMVDCKRRRAGVSRRCRHEAVSELAATVRVGPQTIAGHSSRRDLPPSRHPISPHNESGRLRRVRRLHVHHTKGSRHESLIATLPPVDSHQTGRSDGSPRNGAETQTQLVSTSASVSRDRSAPVSAGRQLVSVLFFGGKTN